MANPTVTFTGRIGQDPVVLSNGGIRLRVVTNDRVKNDQTGQWEDSKTSWWTVKVWNRLADQSKDILKKGYEISVVGRIYEENWKDKTTGEARNSYEIQADSIAVTPYTIKKDIVVAVDKGDWHNSENDIWDIDSVEVPF
jgi:single-strand DNA-binding protein